MLENLDFSVKYLNPIIPKVKSCGLSAQEKLSFYNPSTDETQGNWNEGVTAVKYATGENREVKRFFLMIALKNQSLVDSISVSKINELEPTVRIIAYKLW